MEGVVPERNALPVKGPRFFRQAGEVMFEFVIDAGNIVGPRPAIKTDSEKHPLAWSEFVGGEAVPDVIEIVPDAREPQPPASPLTAVAEKDLSGFVERLAPLPEEPRVKRAYTRRKAA